MRLRRDARILLAKAIASLRSSMVAFNGYDDDGRVTRVLLLLQHAFEMLLKAGLVQRQVGVFDPQLGRSIGYERCVNLGRQHLRLSATEAGTLRALDALRDDEQHWFNAISEGILYAHVRAGITLFDDLLRRISGEALATHLPVRVLPVSADPPRDIQVLIDEEYEQVRRLLQPGNRKRADARARLRALLAMEAHVVEDARVSERDVDRVERAVRGGQARGNVFPQLATLSSEISGEGPSVAIRFSRQDGAPVRVVGGEDEVEATVVREVDVQRKYHWSATKLAEQLGLTGPRATALRRHLGIDDDPDCRHDFTFGKTIIAQYSDNAFTRMRDELKTVDMNEVWKQHGPGRRITRPPG